MARADATARRRAAERRGRTAEWLAVLALALKGYWPLARRVRTPVGEIDLLVRRGRTLVVVEVKQRPLLEQGVEAVGPRSRVRLSRALDWWLARRPRYAGFDLRYDLVVAVPGRWPRHVPNAFQPER